MRARLRKEEGFGMIELTMAILVLSIGILAIVAAFGSGTVAIHRASRVAKAGSIADAQMERYRALRYNSIALDSGSVSSANTISSYTSDSAWNSVQCTTSSCPSPLPPCPSPLPAECTASQPAPGPDGGRYRVDTYIRIIPSSSVRRQGKLVTIVVRDVLVNPPQTLIRVPSTFDAATG